MGTLLIRNCRLLELADFNAVDVHVENGVIVRIGRGSGGHGPGGRIDDTLDACGRILAPGFVDVHVQGAGGADVLDGTGNAIETISRTCARFGVTSFLATTVYMSGGENDHLTEAAGYTGGKTGGARLEGIHLEGPFISHEKRGMISPGCVCAPDGEVLDKILDLSNGTLRMMTIAPEVAGSLPLIRRLTDSGIIGSIGHTNGSYEETLRGFDAGISHATHLFNAMSPIHHRAPGPLIAVLLSESITAQIISDGVHLHPEIVRLARRMLGSDRVVLITDGMQAMGLPDGSYTYNGTPYRSENGTARYEDGTLIGTTLGMNSIVSRYRNFTGCSLNEALAAASANPARLLGLGERGRVEPGMDADLIIIDEAINIYATIVAGNVVYGPID